MEDYTRLVHYYRDLSDDALVDAFREGEEAYQPDAWKVIAKEIERRNLLALASSAPPPPVETTMRIDRLATLSEAELDTAIAAAQKKVQRAGWFVFGGLAVTAGTCALAQPGGTYIVAWGAILFGAIHALSAEAELSRLRDAKRLAQGKPASTAPPR